MAKKLWDIGGGAAEAASVEAQVFAVAANSVAA